MRVAVRHTDPEHPNSAVFAYVHGRADDWAHPITGETIQKQDVVDALLARAKSEYPESDGYQHRVEKYVDNGDGTGSWVSLDAEGAPAQPGQVVASVDVSVPAQHDTSTTATPEG